jgi:hypothetical protein
MLRISSEATKVTAFQEGAQLHGDRRYLVRILYSSLILFAGLTINERRTFVT